MVLRFHAAVSFVRPGLHFWVPGTPLSANLNPVHRAADGTWRFDAPVDDRSAPSVRALLYESDEQGEPVAWEGDGHQREVVRQADGTFPTDVWMFQGTSRVLTEEPPGTAERVRIHLLTARRYRDGRLYLWRPGQAGRTVERSGLEDSGPFWDLELADGERSLFLFKFFNVVDGREEFEPDYANRLYAAADGSEVWTHSRAATVVSTRPVKRRLRMHLRQESSGPGAPVLHLWQESSDFSADVPTVEGADGWFDAELDVYDHLPYGVQFHDPSLGVDREWEHPEAKRSLVVSGDTELWTLEGDPHTFDAPPTRDRPVTLEVSAIAPWTALDRPFRAEVLVRRARAPLTTLDLDGADGEPPPTLSFQTYPEVTTAVRLLSGAGPDEHEESRHEVVVPGDGDVTGFVVGGIAAVLAERPPPGLFADSPFPVERPGAYERDGELRFVLHAPRAARARLVGGWTGGQDRPVEMRLTRDGSYWWSSVPVAEVNGGDYHGVHYRFLLDDGRSVQDPAAGWVERSAVSASSRLVRHSAFPWTDQAWQTPGFDYLLLYQLHPARLSDRHAELPALDRIAREVEEQRGWLHGLGVTGILLMPVNEVASTNSWGYDPAYFYAVEAAYGGPDALKRLVDTCHRQGLAVHVDLVFNHAGSTDNILWATAQGTYFDGDTAWGAMVNFDDPVCRQFFEQNVVYLHREFHIDGFRFDHTHTIVHSHQRTGFVTVPGSGGGWEFLAGLRRALHAAGGGRCLLSAEHLPNEWEVTNYPGPMDSQWCDAFHDRLLDACRGGTVGPLARAMRLSHDVSDDWYKVVNYAESHDEVGNVPDRIANVAGLGTGLRMSKVAAAASILCRGIPMFFMGAESGDHRQFRFGSDETHDLDAFESSPDAMPVAPGGRRAAGSGAVTASPARRRSRSTCPAGSCSPSREAPRSTCSWS